MSHTYKAIQGKEGEFSLFKDDKPALCPKLMYPLVTPTQDRITGAFSMSTQLNRLPCSTICPFAEIKKETLKDTSRTDQGIATEHDIYEITCEGNRKVIFLNEIVPFKKETLVKV